MHNFASERGREHGPGRGRGAEPHWCAACYNEWEGGIPAALESLWSEMSAYNAMTYEASSSYDFIPCNFPCFIPVFWREWNKMVLSHEPRVAWTVQLREGWQPGSFFYDTYWVQLSVYEEISSML